MPEVLTLSGLADAEPDLSTFENKTGLAEDMKFLASMPELCDVTFLVGETREPVCAVKVRFNAISNGTDVNYFLLFFRLCWRPGRVYSRKCYTTHHPRSVKKIHHHEKISYACF